MVEISYYEVPSLNSTFGEEDLRFARVKVDSNIVPTKGSLVGFDDNWGQFRVVDVSYWYDYVGDENSEDADCSVDILVFKED
jgi:hypothetical protein